MRKLALLCLLLMLPACGSKEPPAAGAGSPEEPGSTENAAGSVSFGEVPADDLPPDGFADGFKRSEKRRVFKGAHLYGHIDGGAEVFLELGFEWLEVQRYARGEDEVSVEVYHMSNPPAAFGIYLMKCGRETPDSSFAPRHTANRYQILFRKGAIYVTLYNLSGKEKPGRALLEFGRYLAERIPSGDTAGIFDPLPAEGCIPGSKRVIRGPFTLQAVYTLGRGDLLLLEKEGVTAVSAVYEDGKGGTYTRILVKYPDPEAAKAAFTNVKENLDPYLEPISSDDTTLLFKDYAGKYGKIVLDEAKLDLTVDRVEVL